MQLNSELQEITRKKVAMYDGVHCWYPFWNILMQAQLYMYIAMYCMYGANYPIVNKTVA